MAAMAAEDSWHELQPVLQAIDPNAVS